MMSAKPTPAPWFVRTRVVNGEVIDCFVAAKDVNGFAYDAGILDDDEYRDGIDRKLADAHLVAAAPDLLNTLSALVNVAESKGIRCDAARAAIAKAKGETA
jgi:hypothetical protein